VVQTRFGLFVECVLTEGLVCLAASCSNPGPQPNPFANSGLFACGFD
jgi:hypothetical protein